MRNFIAGGSGEALGRGDVPPSIRAAKLDPVEALKL